MHRTFFAISVLALVTYPLLYIGNYAGDSQVHLIYGQNAAHGAFFEFNLGEKSAGVTSPGVHASYCGLFQSRPRCLGSGNNQGNEFDVLVRPNCGRVHGSKDYFAIHRLGPHYLIGSRSPPRLGIQLHQRHGKRNICLLNMGLDTNGNAERLVQRSKVTAGLLPDGIGPRSPPGASMLVPA